MHACLIPPIPELGKFARGPMHLILAHLIHIGAYKGHYKAQARDGAFLILDNSAYELGESALDADQLLDMACEVDAKEIVAPDVMRDAEATVEATTVAMDAWLHRPAFFERNIRPFYVPQGSTETEWVWCLSNIIEAHHNYFGEHVPFTLGVSRIYEERSGGRFRICEQYMRPLHVEYGCEVHLLGWGYNLPELNKIAIELPWVRSTDSAKPFKYALQEKAIGEGEEPKRPDDYFSRKFSWTQRQFARANVALFKDHARDVSRP